MQDKYAADPAAGELPPGTEDIGAPPDDDTAEVEHEGQVYRIPGALKDAFLAKADHARQMQELAEHQQRLARDRQGLAARVEAAQASLSDRARLHLLDQQLANFEAVDWRTMAAEDPQYAEALWEQFQETQEQREQYAYALAHQEEQDRLASARELSDRLAETGRVLSRELEGWSPEVATKLVQYAAAFGVTLDELREAADPRLWKILHRAYMGDELNKQQTAARNAAQTQAVRPAVQVSGSASSPGGVRDELATGEWMRRRNAQALRAS